MTNDAGFAPLLEGVEAGSQVASAFCPVNDWCGTCGQATDPAVDLFSSSDSFLALYDLCRGDVELLDKIRGPEHTDLMPPTPAGKPNPAASLRVPAEEPTRHDETQPTRRSTPRSLSPAAVNPPLQDRRASRSTSRIRADKGKSDRKYYHRSNGKEEYVRLYGVTSVRWLDGLAGIDLNSHQAKGQWREILVDALNQVGVPYSLHGLKTLIAEAYGVKIISGWGAKRHPENRWQHHISYHLSQNKRDAGASSKQADARAPPFSKLKNELYASAYWWLAGNPVPRHCQGFPEEAYESTLPNDDDDA